MGMSDGEVEAAPEVEAPAPSEPMDLMSALQMVLKKALAHNQLARGLHEGCKAIERGDCQLVILAKDCNQNDYKKLVEALAREHNVPSSRSPRTPSSGSGAASARLTRRATPAM